ncbi:VOC family protein [Shimia ponticola]|uniref:VOC family protein n=1 Tax=Shimia ponticola TaxID=2582893 RepID=UPI0011BDEA8C|nr:VOC family protein [Shimia ponticola]
MKLGYTIIYVTDVPDAVAFYETAFGLSRRFIHESNLYGELDTGDTVLAFAGLEAAEMNGLSIVPNDPKGPAAGWEVCFVTDDVATAYDRAIAAGCMPVSPPDDKPWGQTVSYVRDLNGCLVEIASPIRPPNEDA